MPDGLDTFLFVNSGSEAAENAVKVARAYTGRPNVIAFTGSYHGRTYGAMALTSSKTVYMAGFRCVGCARELTPAPRPLYTTNSSSHRPLAVPSCPGCASPRSPTGRP